MIVFNKLSKEEPYILFKKKYDDSLKSNQSNIEAIAISSYSEKLKEVNSRYVNLKFINDKKFIFFSNYNSPKSIEFNSHNQISALIFWSNINLQIRLKGQIEKTNTAFNKNYFIKRDIDKNAIAISSQQSCQVESYADVQKNYLDSFKTNNLTECPDYWGGYFFIPYYFEFWEGHKSRLNKREVFKKHNGVWNKSFLQP
jgi:pyridoxamine 5'-phosphate oxidase